MTHYIEPNPELEAHLLNIQKEAEKQSNEIIGDIRNLFGFDQSYGTSYPITRNTQTCSRRGLAPTWATSVGLQYCPQPRDMGYWPGGAIGESSIQWPVKLGQPPSPVYIHVLPKATVCDHVWPSTTPQDHDACTKCSISFIAYTFSECP